MQSKNITIYSTYYYLLRSLNCQFGFLLLFENGQRHIEFKGDKTKRIKVE